MELNIHPILPEERTCMSGHRATATCHSLIDYQRGCSGVDKGEYTFLYRFFLRELSKVVDHLFKLDGGLILLSHGIAYAHKQHDGHYQKFFHILLIMYYNVAKLVILWF